MKLVIGLGNPGRKYQGTRHNVGFDVLDEVARHHAASQPKAKFEAAVAQADINGQRVLLLWPQTFMNLSGTSVGKAFEYYHLNLDDLLLVCDDFHLPLGKLRFRAKGSAGGQKGLADVIRRLGTEEFCRLRVGVGPVPEYADPADFVLGKVKRREGAEIEAVVLSAASGVTEWISRGIDHCMNQYNA